jgi:alpha-beta hydrolase superfamily lysophospholipase
MAGLLRENLNAKVIAIDLRGHGMSGGTPGDVSNSNQYAEDLNDLIIALKQENPQQKIILTGHSMGGGIILRHKESFPQTEVAAYLLFAPNLGVDAPTISKELNLNNNFIKTHLSRGLGLKMLNEYNIHTYDSLKVVFYNLPEQMPIKSYSYRSMEAITPKNINATLRTIQKPMIVLVGSADEAFIAEEYPPLFKANSSADCHIIQGESHNGIRHNEEAMEKIHQWAIKNQLK